MPRQPTTSIPRIADGLQQTHSEQRADAGDGEEGDAGRHRPLATDALASTSR